MFSSLRGRLLVWYGTLVAVVIAVFGLLVGYAAWRSVVADVDAQLGARADLLVYALEPAGEGTFDLRLPEAVLRPGDPLQHGIWTGAGALIDRSDPDVEAPADASTGVRTRNGRREMTVQGPSGAVVAVSRSLAPMYAEIRSLATTMAAVGAAALAVSLIGGWFLVGRALAPIDRIGRTARAMVAGDLTARIPVDRVETELESLAAALNEAFQRLQEALERQRRFTADASHELRTPLSTLTTEAHWALARPRSAEEYQRSIETGRRAALRMQGVVERLLALARADTAAVEGPREPVALDHLVADVARDLQSLSAARGLDVAIDAAPAVVSADPAALTDAVTQVVVNAIQYSAEGGRIRLAVRPEAGDVTVTVADEGIGIPADALPRVFEPFFRADPARRRDAGGAGLGLAVARAIVLRHGGRIDCQSELGIGTTVTIRLPPAG
jgi:signal transduction histidine kinase